MSSSMCHGLQSGLEPCLTEPLSLKLKLAPPKHVEKGNWSFLQALTSTCDYTQTSNNETEKVYVHPLSKRSCSVLSAKSLEMCTENLGSETGSDITESCDNDIALLFQESRKLPTKQSETCASKRLKHSISFPPPLTSISSSRNLQVMPHREDGRLVLTVVTAYSTYFEAERSKGRFKLRLFNSYSPNYDNEAETEEDQKEEEEEDKEEIVETEEEEKRDEEKTEEEEEEEKRMSEDIEGNIEKEEGEMGMEKIANLMCRCKEGGGGGGGKKALMNWEPFWVAT